MLVQLAKRIGCFQGNVGLSAIVSATCCRNVAVLSANRAQMPVPVAQSYLPTPMQARSDSTGNGLLTMPDGDGTGTRNVTIGDDLLRISAALGSDPARLAGTISEPVKAQ